MNHEETGIIYEENSVQKQLVKSFLWMFIGLVVTALTAYIMIVTELYLDILYMMMQTGFGITMILLIPVFVQLGIVVYLSRKIGSMSTMTSKVMFVLYSVITGITFSMLPALYGIETMYLAFGFTAVLFGSMAVIGNTTKMDLTKYSTILLGGLITLVVISVVNLFLRVEMMDLFICYGGVLLFMVITAFDIQKIKKNVELAQGNESLLENLVIYGALELYLDFINIFLYVLRIAGRRK